MSAMVARRTSTLGEAGDLGAPPGSAPWAIAVRIKLQSTLQDKEDVANHLRIWRDGFKEYRAWQQLMDRQGLAFRSWEAFCKAPRPFGLGVEPGDLDAEVVLRESRRPTKEEQANNPDVIRLKYGTQKSYVLARLDRDGRKKPECARLAADVRAGRMSAHAAAKQLGWRRKRTPLEQLQHWWRKASAEERDIFVNGYINEIPVVPTPRTRTTETTGT